jgi:UDP:flavonoid glycosyltransferase YjiC (YdhE family)
MLVGSVSNLEDLDGGPGTFEFAPVTAVAHRCSAAVVSGALGTLAAALTAGLPVVVLPQLFDQVWHGHRVEELGVGIMVTRPDKVAHAVTRLLRDPHYREQARELADSLRPEDGAGSLVTAVETTI